MVTPERVLRRLKGHVLDHQDHTEVIRPRMLFMYDDPSRLRISDRLELPLDEQTNPYGKLYAIANLVKRDQSRFLDSIAPELIPPQWYGFGIFTESWQMHYKVGDEAAAKRVEAARTERAIYLMPDKSTVRSILFADREGYSYQVSLADGGPKAHEVVTELGKSGELKTVAGGLIESVETMVTAFIRYRELNLAERN